MRHKKGLHPNVQIDTSKQKGQLKNPVLKGHNFLVEIFSAFRI